MPTVQILEGDCRDLLPTIATGSVDAIITDPPYPEIARPYGRLTEAEWWDLMMVVCREARRVLKPTGSAVFILQPNSRKVGSMRGWLFRFQAWACDHWNLIQDFWWANPCPLGTVHCHRTIGLARPAVKACVWLGESDAYRSQDDVLLPLSEATRVRTDRSEDLRYHHGGGAIRDGRLYQTASDRGGSTPTNLLTMRAYGADGHPAATALPVAEWWTRYIVPPGGTVLDPFLGSGTMGVAAVERGCDFIGMEQHTPYLTSARSRIADSRQPDPTFPGMA
jgi:DNA modification methylase